MMKYTIFVLIYLWFAIVDSNSLSKSSVFDSSFTSDFGSSTAVERVKNPWKSFDMKASSIPLALSQRGGFNNNRKVPTMSLNNNTPGSNNLIAEILER